MGNYDNIQIPASTMPLSASLFGNRVRDAIIALDSRVSKIESTLSNYAFKPGVTTRVNNTTIADDPDLKMWLEANSTYFIEFFLNAAGSLAGDFKTTWNVPAGITSTTRRVIGPGSASNDSGADNVAVRIGTHVYGTPVVYSGVRNSLSFQFQIQEVGIIRTAGTAGYVTLQWAQNTADAVGASINDGSFCRATKVL